MGNFLRRIGTAAATGAGALVLMTGTAGVASAQDCGSMSMYDIDGDCNWDAGVIDRSGNGTWDQNRIAYNGNPAWLVDNNEDHRIDEIAFDLNVPADGYADVWYVDSQPADADVVADSTYIDYDRDTLPDVQRYGPNGEGSVTLTPNPNGGTNVLITPTKFGSLADIAANLQFSHTTQAGRNAWVLPDGWSYK